MSYTPTTWETGDTITSEKLNKIESGIVATEQVAGTKIPKADIDTTLSQSGKVPDSKVVGDAITAISPVFSVDGNNVVTITFTPVSS